MVVYSAIVYRFGSFNRQPTVSWAQRIISDLSLSQRIFLNKELTKALSEDGAQSKDFLSSQQPATYAQLRLVVFASCLPYIGFGFLDNAIMIIAEFQQWQVYFIVICICLAAGLGNLISDLFGICMVGYVENIGKHIGISIPPLSSAQLASKSVRKSITLGRIFGIAIGCLLGMTPLLLFNYSHNSSENVSPNLMDANSSK